METKSNASRPDSARVNASSSIRCRSASFDRAWGDREESFGTHVAFVDSEASNLREMLAELKSLNIREVIFLNPVEDAFDQIEGLLEERDDVTTIHIIGQQSGGVMSLGDRLIDLEEMENRLRNA